jgi:aspartyl-tRNA(Asn)/glutamyl-tRNA(Gln) amidotransferase subunit A
VQRRILLGNFVLSAGYYDAYYGQAQRVRRLIADDYKRAFTEVDVLLAPTTPTVAFRQGEKLADPLAMYAADVNTVAVNLAGVPALSMPCGFADGLPIGAQLIGRWMDEARLFQLARCYQAATRFHTQRPNQGVAA